MIFLSLILIPYLAASGSNANPRQSNLSLPLPHVLIVGATGAGKSSLAMALIGEDVMCENCTFPICHGQDSCTNGTNYASAQWLGKQENDNFTVVDTPGFMDSDDNMDIYLEEMIEILNEDIKNASAIVLTLDSNEARFNGGVTKMIKQLESLFGTAMWNNTIIEMSKFPYDQKSIDDREYDCTYTDYCHNETYYETEMNRQLQENFHVTFDLPVVFIDSWAKKGPNNDDKVQQDHFNEETEKLWEFAIANKPFRFKDREQILEENDELRKELVWLNDIINNNISSLIETDKENEAALMNLMPRGSIVAWTPKPNKDDTTTSSDLPTGWMYCNGSVITGGIWDGLTTPDFNSKNKFLRGGDVNSFLTDEDFSIQKLDLGLTREVDEYSHAHDFKYEYHTHKRCSDAGGGLSDKMCTTEEQNGDNAFSGTTKDTTFNVTFDGIELSYNTDYKHDFETRPINSKVIWIIRVQ